MTNAEFDQIMIVHHELVVQRSRLQKLIDDSTDRDFVEYITDRWVYFTQGCIAEEFFKSSEATFKRLKSLKMI